jgi:hypothetical protein
VHHYFSAIQPWEQHRHGTHHGQSGVNRNTNAKRHRYNCAYSDANANDCTYTSTTGAAQQSLDSDAGPDR